MLGGGQSRMPSARVTIHEREREREREGAREEIFF